MIMKQDLRRVREREIEWTELMLSAYTGDGAAYHRLLTGIAPVLRVTVEAGLERAGRPTDQCEMIVQEILLAVHLKRHTWDASLPFCSWLFAVTHNKLLDVMRRTGEPCRIDIDCFRDPSPKESPPEPRKASEVDEHIQSLPQRQRIVLQAIVSGHPSLRETAAKLMTTENAVRIALHRGILLPSCGTPAQMVLHDADWSRRCMISTHSAPASHLLEISSVAHSG
jgi:RNA polymerase sigma-70 factor, ECF subfamily